MFVDLKNVDKFKLVNKNCLSFHLTRNKVEFDQQYCNKKKNLRRSHEKLWKIIELDGKFDLDNQVSLISVLKIQETFHFGIY